MGGFNSSKVSECLIRQEKYGNFLEFVLLLSSLAVYNSEK